MSETTHTPGEWNYKMGFHDIAISSDKRAADIALIRSAGSGGTHIGITDAEQHANAKLIAAAPEMLKALLTVYEAIEAGEKLTKENFRTIGDAIYKATGN